MRHHERNGNVCENVNIASYEDGVVNEEDGVAISECYAEACVKEWFRKNVKIFIKDSVLIIGATIYIVVNRKCTNFCIYS